MKLASILGKYEDDWKDEDVWKAEGDVPAIIML
jgi:hypothetical protein